MRGILYQIWYGRPQETLLFKKSRKSYFKHMEYIRIYILDIKNEEENIGNLKQLNLTLIFDKSLLQIVPRKHFCILFFRSFNYGWFLSWYFCITFKTNQKIGGHHQVSKTGMVEHFKIALGNRFGTVVPRKHFIYKKLRKWV